MPPPGAEQRATSKFIVFEQFEKLNTQSVRQALKENELAWLENLQPIAPNNLTVVPGPISPALTTLPASTVSMFYADIGGVDYLFDFASDGSASSVNIATGFVNQFATAGTFSTSPDLTTWQASRVLINDSIAGYCTFDGTVFVHQGGVSPVFNISNGGSGYSSPPPVTISGGSGTGATATATIVNGVVVGIVLTSPGTGYQVGDTLTVSFGTGVGSGAAGHVTMPGFPVSSVTINNRGLFQTNPANTPGNYSFVFAGGGGTGAAGFANVIFNGPGPTVYTVDGVALTAGGSGYTSPPSCNITFGGGQPPTFNVFLGTSGVASIVRDAGGSGYVAAPTVSIVGGGGSGATAHATISGGSVNALILDTVGSGYTSTPSVIIGTGSGAAATGHVWPFIPKGTTLAVFQGRVWLAGGQLLQYTGTQGYDDFNAANASGSLVISDADLVHSITALRSLNNYLYIMGDQSVKQIGNISLNSAGNITLFTILTLSSDQGTIYPQSCASFNRVFMFANSNGIYGVFGSSVQKISDDMDGIFKLIDFSQGPQAAIVDMNNIHNIAFLVRYKDPLSTTRSIMLIFSGKKWFVGSQGNNLVAFATAPSAATGKTQLYGSSGTDITALFGDPTVAVSFKLQSSLTHHGNAVQRKKVIRAGFAVTLGTTGTVSMSVDTDEGSNSYTETLASGFRALSYQTDNAGNHIDGAGRYLGLTITGTLASFTATNATIEFQETNVGNRSRA
jgi:hypothetical protein